MKRRSLIETSGFSHEHYYCAHFVFILFDSDGTVPPPTKKMKMWQNKRKREEERKKQLVKEMIEDIEKGNLQQFY